MVTINPHTAQSALTVPTVTATVTGNQVHTQVLGVQGVAGVAGSLADRSYTAVATLSGHRVVVGVTGAQAAYADCTNINHVGAVVGVTTGAAAAGAAVLVREGGLLSHSGWAWALGDVLLGLDGLLTQTLPVGAVFAQVVGVAISATELLINVGDPILV